MMDKMVLHKKSKKSLNLDKLVHDVNSQDVRLLSGTPIIARVNNEKLDVYNNECYTIKEIQHSKYNLLIVDEFGETKDISFYDFQKLFMSAFASPFINRKVQHLIIHIPFMSGIINTSAIDSSMWHYPDIPN